MSPSEARRKDIAKAMSLQSSEAPRPILDTVPLGLEESSMPAEDHCWSGLVLHHSNPVKVVWSYIAAVFLLYTATIFLYRFTFCHFHISPNGLEPIGLDDVGWNVVDWMTDAFFILDLFLSFFMSYSDGRGIEVDSMKLIAIKYMKGLFWVNLIACIPEPLVKEVVQLAASQTETDEETNANFRIARVYRLQRVSRVARLVRLTRLARLLSFMSNNPTWKAFKTLKGVRVVNFIAGLFWTCHLLACGWYLCAALQDDVNETWVARRSVDASGETSLLSQGPFEQWLVSMYFVLTVFTTVGFGDISAGTEAEILYVAVTMMVGAVVHGIIVSQVINIVTSTDQIHEFIEKQAALIEAYGAHTGLAPDTLHRIRDEVAWRSKSWSVHRIYNKEEMKELITGKYMPRRLLGEIPGSIFGGKLVQNNFLRCCWGVAPVPPRLPCILAMYLHRAEFDAGEIVYQLHDFPFNLFLVLSGTFAHVGRPTPQGGLDAIPAGSEDDLLHTSTTPAMSKVLERVRRPNRAGQQNDGEASCSSTVLRPDKGLYPYQLFSERTCFGDEHLVLGLPRNATARCERAAVALCLQKKDFQEIQETFPQFGAAWKIAAQGSRRSRLAQLAKLTRHLTHRQLAAVKVQLFFRAYRAKLQQQSQADPTESTGASRERLLEATDSIVGVSKLCIASKSMASGDVALEEVRQLKHMMEALQVSVNALHADVRGGSADSKSSLRSV